MKAGRLNYFLTPMELITEHNPDTGETLRYWEAHDEIRAERVKFIARAATRGVESLTVADAIFRIRYRHDVKDGWRVRDREGVKYDVVVEPDRENGMKLLKCTKVND